MLDSDFPSDVDVVFHIAALSLYATHEANVRRGVRVNVEGLANVVETVRNSDCDTVVWAIDLLDFRG